MLVASSSTFASPVCELATLLSTIFLITKMPNVSSAFVVLKPLCSGLNRKPQLCLNYYCVFLDPPTWDNSQQKGKCAHTIHCQEIQEEVSKKAALPMPIL